MTRLCLIDLGLSPRRTFAILAGMGFGPESIDTCIVTHLDADHFTPGWGSRLPRHATIRMHARHAGVLDDTACQARINPFDDAFELEPGVTVRPMLMSHDDLGVATFRIEFASAGGGTLGFATDVGHVTADLVAHMRRAGGIDVLAIESNYCPKMQIASPRPEQLKRRIMGGHGHLSNQQAIEAIHAIEPKDHVVLLHLSRQCNCPSLVSQMHAGADYALTITSQYEPSRWITIGPSIRELKPARMSPALANTATLWTADMGCSA